MIPTPASEDLLSCAVEAVRAAGRHALDNIHRCREVAVRQAHDIKLNLDLECQEIIERIIHVHFPGHPVLGEEGGRLVTGPLPLWIVDPIDGTVNFSHGMPLWCSSVAVQVEGEMVAGLVFVPELDDLYTATLDSPALCNGASIRVSEVKRLDEAMVLTGISKHIDEQPSVLHVFKAMSLRAQKVRVMGAAAVDICHVARGRADAYLETGIHLWDIAAAGLIARRAGAVTEMVEKITELRCRYLCTNGHIHQEVRELFQAFEV